MNDFFGATHVKSTTNNEADITLSPWPLVLFTQISESRLIPSMVDQSYRYNNYALIVKHLNHSSFIIYVCTVVCSIIITTIANKT